MTEDTLLQLVGVRFGYPRCETFLGPVDITLPAGGMLAVVGPNGAGKSTLLRIVVGLLKPGEGTVRLSGRLVDRLRARQRAASIAFVPQRPDAPAGLIARDVVLLGRFPHRPFAFFDSAEDHRISERAMRTTGTEQFADRSLDTISAGEQQRVHIAAAIAQQPRLLVLDEPTSALDPYHQISIFRVSKRLCADRGVAVVVATHDLNLAGQFADKILLLNQGKVASYGDAQQVIRPDVLDPVYGVSFRSFPSTPGRPAWVLPAASVAEAS
ncbi:MAG: ABC transporter ATP-binding protein [Phycisphaerae bacterium]